MNKTFWQSLIPHAICVALFWIIAVVFFYPYLQGKVLQQSDTTMWEASSKESLDYRKETGESALWNTRMFGGMPTYQITSPAKSNYLVYVQSALALFTSGPLYYFILFSICSYIFYLALSMPVWIAFVGAISSAYVTSNFLLFATGHNTKILVIAYTGLILAGIIQAFKGNRYWGLILFGFGVAFNIMNNHVQMTYYALIMTIPLVLFLIYDNIKGKNITRFGITSGLMIVAGLVALGASASLLWTTYEYAEDTMRGKPILSAKEGVVKSSSEVEGLEWNYAMAWSNGMPDVLASFIPGFAGGSSGESLDKDSYTARDLRSKGYQPPKEFKAPLYWGPLPFTGGPFYLGAIMLFLFVLGIMLVQDYRRWWLIIGIGLSLLLSMGKNLEWFNKLFFDYFPLYNKFRAPSSIASVTSFFFPILGILALGIIAKEGEDKNEMTKKIWLSAALTGGFCLLMAILGPLFYNFNGLNDAEYVQQGFNPDALIKDRISLLRTDAFRSAIFIALAAGMLYLWKKGTFNLQVSMIILAALVLMDFGGVSNRYLSWDSFVKKSTAKSTFEPRAVDSQILQDKSNYRVLDLTINTFNTSINSYFFRSIGGNHAAKLQRFQDLIDHQIQGDIQKLSQALSDPAFQTNDSVRLNTMSSLKSLNMLNTKYFILGQPGKEVPLVNPAALGNAWFVKSIETVGNANEEIEKINSTDVSNTAIVSNEFDAVMTSKSFDGTGAIKLEDMKPNEIKYTSESGQPQFAVFSEIWYGPNKGWKATIDGQPAEIIRADYLLRGLQVPAGKHEIVFSFEPRSFYLGEKISMLCSILMIGLIGVIVFREFKKKAAEK